MSTNAIDPAAVENVKANAAVEMASLDDLYADTPKSSAPAKAEEPAPVAEKAEPEPAKPAETDAKLAKVAKELTPDDEEDEPADVQGLKAALKATRQKVREKGTKAEEYERKLQEQQQKYQELDGQARSMFDQLRQLGPQQRPQPPDANLDPAAAIDYLNQTWSEKLAAVQAQSAHDAYMARVVPSQRMMRQQHADYDAMETAFAEAARADPRLWQEIRRQEFPAEYAYQVGKEIKQRQEIQAAGSFDKWIEQKVAEKIAAVQPAAPTVPTVPTSANLTPPANPRAQPPQSLARVPSVTPRNQGKSFNGPTPLGDLYK